MMRKHVIVEFLGWLEGSSHVMSKEEVEKFLDIKFKAKEYEEIIETMLQAGLIMNAKIIRAGDENNIIICSTEGVNITLKGIEYLEANKPR